MEQYQLPTGDFSKYIDDSYVEPGFIREPLTDEVEVAVIGGGFGGLLAGARLREAGVKDIRMIERAGDFGGTSGTGIATRARSQDSCFYTKWNVCFAIVLDFSLPDILATEI